MGEKQSSTSNVFPKSDQVHDNKVGLVNKGKSEQSEDNLREMELNRLANIIVRIYLSTQDE